MKKQVRSTFQKFIIYLFHIAFGLGLVGINVIQAQSIEVFSRYNYYLPNNEMEVVAVFSENIEEHEYTMRLWRRDKPVNVNMLYADNRLEATLVEPSFPFGIETLRYSIMKGNDMLKEGTVDVVLRSEKQNAVQIDRLTGGLIADGMPFFPFGFYCVPVGDLPEREVVHGMNLIGPYQDNQPEGLSERKAYMDRCAELGVKVQYSVNSLIGSGHNGAPGMDMSKENKIALLKSEIEAFRDHPALLSWYINDEPDGQGRPVAILEEAYEMIHQLDPYHPVSIVFMMPSRAAEFENTMDIAMTDPYPIPRAPEEVLHNLNGYREAYQYKKSVWLVPQAFGGQEMWEREPTANELRVMTYMGLISGAKGIQYYIRGEGNINPQSVSAWSECSNMAVEVAQMSSFLLSADVAPSVKVNDERILTKVFKYQGDLLVIAVNEDNEPKSFDLEIAVDNSNYQEEAELWFENRSVTFEDNYIHDMIDAMSTRVYLIHQKAINDHDKISLRNLIVNPSFEEVASPGQPIGSNKTYTDFSERDLGATVFTDPRVSVDGMFSLRVVTPKDRGGNKIRFLPMVVSKDNSYEVSVWAKAKPQMHMPSFSFNMDLMNQHHSYQLTSEWKKYSFIFTAPLSSTNTILSLEMTNKGIGWFDVLQMTPTPVIYYEVKSDNTAEIIMESNSESGKIRFDIDKKPTAKSRVYTRPMIIPESSTVYAALYDGKKQLASSQLFVPVNKALRKPVSLKNPVHEKYQANGSKSLTDGVMGSTAFKDGRWLGLSGTDLIATIDMEKLTQVHKLSGSFLCDPNSGIFLPTKVEVYTSVDGDSFEFIGEQENIFGNVRGEPVVYQLSVPLKDKKVRYVRLVARAFGEIPEGYLFTGSISWLFADELLIE
ncbi:carbohydrate binding domain-containing protein [Fulvivirga sediminis]|uniref:Carbohydrate binding domain-containing protein n=1 Tax=Fulvivirga sediminis TaxID=2803949 RepID=A0A937JZV9_9BACT|nr:carbohydrate binding domain-containing protein [Fulvivirga sediminis]MBL3657039.1 carbohydrate binding domain-containing protein [Fulvivirga sediminis]